jgi:hypothetical protein
MEAKEKARELVRQYWDLGNMDIVKSKVCALIAINEMLQANVDLMENAENVRQYRFFEEVKQEIEKL